MPPCRLQRAARAAAQLVHAVRYGAKYRDLQMSALHSRKEKKRRVRAKHVFLRLANQRFQLHVGLSERTAV